MRIALTALCLFFSLIFTQTILSMQMAPGQFKPQDIDAILNSMSEDDFNNILNELSKLSPQELEELEKIGRQVLVDSGIDPDTGKPLEAKVGTPEAATKPTQTTAPVKTFEQKPTIKVQNSENVRTIIENSIKQIHLIRQKAQGSDQIARRLTQWAEPLNDLVFYLKIINKKEHYERLASKDFETLFKNLETLSRQLVTYQQHIILPEKHVDDDDPYKILGVPYTATVDQMTQRYTVLKKKYNHKKIKKELKAQQASEKELKRELRAAELTMSFIQDAYDQLTDEKTRKIVDEKRLQQPSDNLSQESQHNLTKFLEVLSNSVYQQKLLDQLQDFLKKYEPEQLAQKQAFEEAQTQRKKEQAELSKIQPKLTHTKYDKTNYPQELPSKRNYDSFSRGGGFPSFGGPTTPTAPPVVPLAPLKSDGTQAAGNASGGKNSSAPADKIPKTDAEKREEDNKNLVKAFEKKEEEKKKKENEKQQKELQEELKQLKAENEARKKEENRAKPTKNEPSQAPKKRDGAVFSDRELVVEIRSVLVRLKKDMRQDNLRKLFKKTAYKGGSHPPLTVDELARIDKLPLEELTRSLETLYDNIPEDLARMSALKKDWEALTQEYSDTLACLNRYIKQEQKKYTLLTPAQEVPQALIHIVDKTTDALVAYNDLCQMLLGKPTISPQAPCEEYLPVIELEE